MILESSPKAMGFENFCFYRYLTDELRLEVTEVVSEITIEKSNYIYRPSTNNHFIYEIIEGAVKLGSYSDCGDEYVYDILCHNDFFGNLKYLNGQFFEFSKTLIKTRIRKYPLSFFRKVIVEHPPIAEWFISYVVKRWCISEKKLGKIKENDTCKKICFLRSYLDVQVKNAEGSEFLLYDLLTQKDLGDLIGATRQTIAKGLKKKTV